VEVHLAERTFGAFERRIDLPAAVAPDGVKANLAKGVLTLTTPKSEEAKRRAIPISAG
jgi:HSP20 family protein